MYEGTDTMENPPTYLKGDIVWVKLSGYWWPGEVKNEEDLPSDLLSDFKKPPLVVVKFFDEDSYEYIKQWSSICPYNCEKKNEFIKKGMAGFRGKLPHMAKFPKDIGTAEEKTNGNPNILSQPEFLPPPKINFDEIFGTPNPKKSSKSKVTTSTSKKPTSKGHNGLITHRRFLGNDDYNAYMLPQFPGKDRTPDSDDEEIHKLNQEPQQTIKCQSCSFNTKRLGVLLMHTKMHSGGINTTTKRKSKKAKEVETTDPEGDAAVTKSPKPKQRKKKEDLAPKSAEVFANLLEEWDVTDDEMEDGKSPSKAKKQPTESKEIRTDVPIEESTKSVEEIKSIKNHKSASSKTSEDLMSPSGGFHDDIKNCFDFDEEEEGDFPLPAVSGRKIPRVIPEKPKASISQLLEMSQREDELVIKKISGTKDESNRQTTTLTDPEADVNKKEILRISQTFNISVDDSIENSFKELMEETEVPVLDDLTQTLKPEQNFHDARTIKFPDKGGTTSKEGTSHKGGTSKKRFITSFEDFEAGFRKIEGEERKKLTADKEGKSNKKSKEPKTSKKDNKHHKQTPQLSREKLSHTKTGMERKGHTKTHHTKTDVVQNTDSVSTPIASNTPEHNKSITETINTEGLTPMNMESKRKYRRRTKQFVVEEDSEEIIEFTKDESDKFYNDAFKEVVQSGEEPQFDAELEAIKKDLENSQNIDSISHDLVKESEKTKVSLEQLTRDLEGSIDSADVNMVGTQLEQPADQKKTAEIGEQLPTDSEILVEESSTKKKSKEKHSKGDVIEPDEPTTKNRRGRSRGLEKEFSNSKLKESPKSSQMEANVNRTESELDKEQKESIANRKSTKDRQHKEHFAISSHANAEYDNFLTYDSKISTREGEEAASVNTALEQKSGSKRGKRRKHDEQNERTFKQEIAGTVNENKVDKCSDFVSSEEITTKKRKSKTRKPGRSEDQTIAVPEINLKGICESAKNTNYFSYEQTGTINSMEAAKKEQIMPKSRKASRRKYAGDIMPESIKDITETSPIRRELPKSDKTRRSKDEQTLADLDKSVSNVNKTVKSSKMSELLTESEDAALRFINSESTVSQENLSLTEKSRLSILALGENVGVNTAPFSEAKMSETPFTPSEQCSPKPRRGRLKKSDNNEDTYSIQSGTPPEETLSKSRKIESQVEKHLTLRDTQIWSPGPKEREDSSVDAISAEILNWNSAYVVDSTQNVPDTCTENTPIIISSESVDKVPETPSKRKRRKTRWNTEDNTISDPTVEVTYELKSASNVGPIGPDPSEGYTGAVIDKLSSVEELDENLCRESVAVTEKIPVIDCSKSIIEETKSKATTETLDLNSFKYVPEVSPKIEISEEMSAKFQSFEEILTQGINKDFETQTSNDSSDRSHKDKIKIIDVRVPENSVDCVAEKIEEPHEHGSENNQKDSRNDVVDLPQTVEPACHIMDKLVRSEVSDSYSLELSPKLNQEKGGRKHTRKSERKSISTEENVPELSESNVEVSNLQQHVDITSKIDSYHSVQFTSDRHDSKDHASSSHDTRKSRNESYRSRSSKRSNKSAEPFADLKESPLSEKEQPKELLVENIEVSQISKDVSKDETSGAELALRKSDIAAITGIISDTIYGRTSKSIRSSRLKPSRSRWDVVLRSESDRESTTPPLPSGAYTDHAQMSQIHKEALEIYDSNVKEPHVPSVTASSKTSENEVDFKTPDLDNGEPEQSRTKEVFVEKEKLSTFFLKSSDVAGQFLGDKASKVRVSNEMENVVTHQVNQNDLSKEPFVESQDMGRLEAVGDKCETTKMSEVPQVGDTENTCQSNIQQVKSTTTYDESKISEKLEKTVLELQEQMQRFETSSIPTYLTRDASLNLSKPDSEPLELQDIEAPAFHALNTGLGEDHVTKREGEKQLQPFLEAIDETGTTSLKSYEKTDAVQAINEVGSPAVPASIFFLLNTDLCEESATKSKGEIPLQSLLDVVDETKLISLETCEKSDVTQPTNEEGLLLKQDDVGAIQGPVSDSSTNIFDNTTGISVDKSGSEDAKPPERSSPAVDTPLLLDKTNQSTVEECRNVIDIKTESGKLTESEFNAGSLHSDTHQVPVLHIETSELKCSNESENTLKDIIKQEIAQPKKKGKRSSKSPSAANVEFSFSDIAVRNADVSAVQDATEIDTEINDVCKEKVPHTGQVLKPPSKCEQLSMSTEEVATIIFGAGVKASSVIVSSKSDAKKSQTETDSMKAIGESKFSLSQETHLVPVLPMETSEELKGSSNKENTEELVEPTLDLSQPKGKRERRSTRSLKADYEFSTSSIVESNAIFSAAKETVDDFSKVEASHSGQLSDSVIRSNLHSVITEGIAAIASGADAELCSEIIPSQNFDQKSHIEIESAQTLCELESSLRSEAEQVPVHQIGISEELKDLNDVENSVKNTEVIESKLPQSKRKRGRPSRRSLVVDYEPSASNILENIAGGSLALAQEHSASEAEIDSCNKEGVVPSMSPIDPEQSSGIISSESSAKEGQVETGSLKTVGESASFLCSKTDQVQVPAFEDSEESKGLNDVENVLINAEVIEPKLDVAQPKRKRGRSNKRSIADYGLAASNIVETVANVSLPGAPAASGAKFDDFRNKEGELPSVSTLEIAGGDSEQSSEIVSSKSIIKGSLEVETESLKTVEESKSASCSETDPSLEASDDLKGPNDVENAPKNAEIIEPKLHVAESKRKHKRSSKHSLVADYKLSASNSVENITDVSLGQQSAASDAKIQDLCKKVCELPSTSPIDIAGVDLEQSSEIVSSENITKESQMETELLKTVGESESPLHSKIDQIQVPPLEVSADLKGPNDIEDALKNAEVSDPKWNVTQPKGKHGRSRKCSLVADYKLPASNIVENITDVSLPYEPEASEAKIDICKNEGELSSVSTLEIAGVYPEQSSEIISSESIAKESQIQTDSLKTVGESESSLRSEIDRVQVPPLETSEGLKDLNDVKIVLKNAEVTEPKLDVAQPKRKGEQSSKHSLIADYEVSASNIVENITDVSLAQEPAASEAKIEDICKNEGQLPSRSIIEIAGVDPEKSNEVVSSESIAKESQIETESLKVAADSESSLRSETDQTQVSHLEASEELMDPNDTQNAPKNAEVIEPKMDVAQPKRKRGRPSKRSLLAGCKLLASNIVENTSNASLAQEPATSEAKIDYFCNKEGEPSSVSSIETAGVDPEQPSGVASSESTVKGNHLETESLKIVGESEFSLHSETDQVQIPPLEVSEELKGPNDVENALKNVEEIERKLDVGQPKRKRGRPSKRSLLADYKLSASNIIENNIDVSLSQEPAASEEKFEDFYKKVSELPSVSTIETAGVDPEQSSGIGSLKSIAKDSQIETGSLKIVGESELSLGSKTAQVQVPPFTASGELEGLNDVENAQKSAVVIDPKLDVPQAKRKRGRSSKQALIADYELVGDITDVSLTREPAAAEAKIKDLCKKEGKLPSVSTIEIAGVDSEQSSEIVISGNFAKDSQIDTDRVSVHPIETSEELTGENDVENGLKSAEVIESKSNVTPKRKRGRRSRSPSITDYKLSASSIVESNMDVSVVQRTVPHPAQLLDSLNQGELSSMDTKEVAAIASGVEGELSSGIFFSENHTKKIHLEAEPVKTAGELESSLRSEIVQIPSLPINTSDKLEASNIVESAAKNAAVTQPTPDVAQPKKKRGRRSKSSLIADYERSASSIVTSNIDVLSARETVEYLTETNDFSDKGEPHQSQLLDSLNQCKTPSAPSKEITPVTSGLNAEQASEIVSSGSNDKKSYIETKSGKTISELESLDFRSSHSETNQVPTHHIEISEELKGSNDVETALRNADVTQPKLKAAQPKRKRGRPSRSSFIADLELSASNIGKGDTDVLLAEETIESQTEISSKNHQSALNQLPDSLNHCEVPFVSKKEKARIDSEQSTESVSSESISKEKLIETESAKTISEAKSETGQGPDHKKTSEQLEDDVKITEVIKCNLDLAQPKKKLRHSNKIADFEPSALDNVESRNENLAAQITTECGTEINDLSKKEVTQSDQPLDSIDQSELPSTTTSEVGAEQPTNIVLTQTVTNKRKRGRPRRSSKPMLIMDAPMEQNTTITDDSLKLAHTAATFDSTEKSMYVGVKGVEGTKPQDLNSSDIADQTVSRETVLPPSDQNKQLNDSVYEFSEMSPDEQIYSTSAATKRRDWRHRRPSKDSDTLLKNKADVLSKAAIIGEKLEPFSETEPKQLPGRNRKRSSRKYPIQESISRQQVESADAMAIDDSMKQTNAASGFDPAQASGRLGVEELENTKFSLTVEQKEDYNLCTNFRHLDSSKIENQAVSRETVLSPSGQNEQPNREEAIGEFSEKSSNEETCNILALNRSKKGQNRRHKRPSQDSLLEGDIELTIDETYDPLIEQKLKPLPVQSRRRSSRKYSDQEMNLSEQVESIIDRLADNSEFKDATIKDDSFKQTSSAAALDLTETAGRVGAEGVERAKLEQKDENSLIKPQQLDPTEVDDQAPSKEPCKGVIANLSETSPTVQISSASVATKHDEKPSTELDTLPEQDTDILSEAAIDRKLALLKGQEPKQLTVRSKRRTSRKYSHQEQTESAVDSSAKTLKLDEDNQRDQSKSIVEFKCDSVESTTPEAAGGKSVEFPVKKGRGRPRKYSTAEEKTADAQPQEVPCISLASLQEQLSSTAVSVDCKQEPFGEKEKLVPPKKNRWPRRGVYNKIDYEVVNEVATTERQAVEFESTLIDKTDHSVIEAITPDNSMSTLNDSEIILPPKKSKRANEISSLFLKDSFSDEQISAEKKHDDTLSFPVYDDSFMSTSLRNNIEGLIKEIDNIDNVTSDSLETPAIHKDIKPFNIPEFKMDKPNTDQIFGSTLSDDSAVTFRESIDIPKCVPPKKKKIELPKEECISVHAELSKTEEKVAAIIPQAPKKKMQKLFENSQAFEKLEKIDLPLMSPLAKKKSFLFQQVLKTDDDPSQKGVDAFKNVDKAVDLPKDYTGSSGSYMDDYQNLLKMQKRKSSSYNRDYPEKKDKLDQIFIPDEQTTKDSISLESKTNVQSDQEIAKSSFRNLTDLNDSTKENLQIKTEFNIDIKLEDNDSKSSIQTNLSDLETSTKVDELTILAAKALSEFKKDVIKQNFNASRMSDQKIVKVETVMKTEAVDTLLEPPMPGITLNKPELIPISVTPTVMSEQDLADAQVEITRDKIISEKKPITSSTFSIDFPESNMKANIRQQVKTESQIPSKMTETGGTEFTSKVMAKEFDNRSLVSQPNAYVLKSELLDILEGNSNSSTNSSGSEQKFKTSFDNYDKKSTVQGIIDFEEAIPSQIVLSNKINPESVLIDSPKLLERLSLSSEPVMVKAQKVIVQSDSKVPEGVLKPLMSKLVKSTGMPKPGQKIVIKTSRASSLASKIPSSKPIILSEQIIRPAAQSAALAKAHVQQQGIKRQYEDIEDVEAAFIIPKIAKKVIKEELDDEVPPTPPEKPTRVRGSKLSGRAKILQQTIITPKGEVIPQGAATTAAQAIQLQQVQVQPSQDDAVFDINSMPIVLSDDLLTPESIQNMPVVLSEDVLSQGSAASSTKSQEKLLATMPKKIVSTMGSKQIIFKTTQPAVTTPAKHAGKPRILTTTATPQSKIPRPGATALLATGTTPDGKPTKYVLVPPSSMSSATAAQVKAVKQAVVKKQQAAVQSKVVQPTAAPVVDQIVGNKIMIVTNAQGQQTRVVLTPQQQKAFMQSQAGSKTKTIIKGAIPKALLESAAAVAAAGSSGIPKTTVTVPQVAAAIVSTQGGLLMPAVKSVKTPAPSKKSAQRSTSKLQKTILIKNQLGQTVRKIQGTDDADLDRQVAEQLEAIKASARLQQANKSPEIINYTNRQIPTSNKSPVRRSFSRKADPVKIKIPTTTQVDTQVQQETLVPALAPLSPQPQTSPVPGHSPQSLPKHGTARKIEPPVPSSANKTIDAVLQQQRHQTTVPVKSDSKHQTVPSKDTESKRAESPLRQVVIQDGLGNLTTVTVGQILAIPSETVDGQPQSYMLVTVDESGNLTPLNNDALMSLDPSLGAGGDINNMVLHVDQGQGTVAALKPAEASVPSIPAPSVEAKRKVEERLRPEPPKPPQPVKDPKAAPKPQEVPISVEQQIVIGEGVLPGDAGGQQLIVTGDPIATQKFLESLSDGSTDLANILANAEGGSVLIQADGQQILIRTNPAAQPLMGIAENTEGGGNPIFGTHKPNQDILAAALANTDVFQPTDHQHGHSSPLKGLQSAQLSPGSGALYPMHVSNVLETSLTLGSPIMTPLEVPSTNSKKIDDETDILSQVPKNVDLPITITDPNISQTVAHQQAAALMDLSLPISETGPSGDINSTCIYPLSSLDVSVSMLHKPFGGSMPLLTEDVGETDNSGSTNVGRIRVKKGLENVPGNFSPNFGSLRRFSVSDSSQEEVVKTSPFGDIGSLPMLTDDVIEDSGSSIGSTRHRRSSPKLIERDIIDEGLSTLGGEMCSSLSEPPPDMFDLSSITHKGEETSSDMSSIPEPETLSMNSENSGEIPIQPPIVATLSDLKRPGDESEGSDDKRPRFD